MAHAFEEFFRHDSHRLERLMRAAKRQEQLYLSESVREVLGIKGWRRGNVRTAGSSPPSLPIGRNLPSGVTTAAPVGLRAVGQPTGKLH